MKHTNNKPTGGIILFLTLTTLWFTTAAAGRSVIPVPDCSVNAYGNNLVRTSGLAKIVDDWIAGGTTKATVTSTYGQIQNWDTSGVTIMFYLFTQKQTFDADLSKWNVARVTTMRSSKFHFLLFTYPLHNLLSLITPSLSALLEFLFYM